MMIHTLFRVRALRRAVRGAALLLLLPALGACEAQPAGEAAAADTVVMEGLVRIGQVTGDEAYQFGLVAGVAADAEGRIYVSDRMGSYVRVYAPDGTFLRQIGREGEGPGEFQYPTDLFFDDSGRLWVRDARRATVFGPRSAGAIPDSVVQTRTFTGYTNWTSSARSRLIDSIYYYPDQALRRDGDDRYFYFGYDREGPTADTVPVPPYATLGSASEAYYMVSAGTGRMVRGLNRAPFEPGPAWELTRRGTVLGGAGESLLVETDRAGDTLLTIPLGRRRAVGPGERADSGAAVRERLDSLPVPLDDVEGVSGLVRQGVLPDSVPGFVSVHTSTEGDVWVRRWPPEGGHGTYFDVYTADGELLRHVAIPERLRPEPPPFIRGDTLIAVVQDPDTEVHRVVSYRLPEGSGEAGRNTGGSDL